MKDSDTNDMGPYEPLDGDEYLHVWQAINRHTIARWLKVVHRGGLTETFGPHAVLVYSPDSDIVRNEHMRIPLSRFRFNPEVFPTWEQADMRMDFEPPYEKEVAEAWDATERFRTPKPKGTRHKTKPLRFRPRKANEAAADFYARVADFYKVAAETGPPVKALALSADVPDTTASQWVYQARRRGLLPKTSPGRASA